MKIKVVLFVIFLCVDVKASLLEDLPTGSINIYRDHFYLGAAYDLPKLEFYDNPQLKNKPVMILNDDGLSYQGKLICKREKIKITSDSFHHRDGFEYIKGHKNYYSEINMLDQCDDTPIKKGVNLDGWWERSGFNLEIFEKKGDIVTVRYKNKNLFLNLNSFHHDDWMEMSESSYKKLTKQIQVLLKNSNYQSFLKGTKRCLEQKNEKCLSKYISESSGGDYYLQRFLMNDQEFVALNLNNCFDAQMEKGEKAKSNYFSKCILANNLLINELTKCLNEKTFDDFYGESQKDRKLRCVIGSDYKLHSFYPIRYGGSPPSVILN